MSRTLLRDGMFKVSQDLGKQYLLYLDVDRLIAPCYEAIDLKPKNKRYGGWESRQISGHSIGHWLSAAATMYDVTKDEQLKQKLDYAIDELAYIQTHDPDGYVSGFPRACFDEVFDGEGDFEVGNFSLGHSWVPWYSIHKIFAGLLDTYTLTGNMKALDVLLKLTDWAKKGTDKLTDAWFEKMLICEHGGMNEVFADLYKVTGNDDHLALAIRFCHRAILDPLAKGIDDLEGKHANTQIPKVIGAAKLYDITGETYYRDIAIFFWEQVVKHRSYVIGGNSNREHFGPEGTEELGITTAETCNTYNMMKLTEILYRWEPKAAYMDFYERALYNHILASQDPESGMKMYFVPTEPGHFKIYCSPDDSFWCCTGTGMENPARYTRGIYYDGDDTLYVNLFIASTFAGEKLKLRQETAFPEAESTKLVIEAVAGNVDIRVRVPYWLQGEMVVSVNGVQLAVQAVDGYVTLSRTWQVGDEIDVTLPMGLHQYVAKDDPHKVAFMYGPIALAGALGREMYPESDILDDHLKLNNHPLIDVPTLVTSEQEVERWLERVDGEPLTFHSAAVGQPGEVNVTLKPFYALHHERYTIYWRLMDEAAYDQYVKQQLVEAEQWQEVTIDEVQPNEQQPEVEHQVKMLNSHSGYTNIVRKGWRNSVHDGYFSYVLQVDSERDMQLVVSYCCMHGQTFYEGVWLGRRFSIQVDGIEIAEETLHGQPEDTLFDVVYPIPRELTKGKQEVEVKFTSTEGYMAGPVHGVRMVSQY